MEYEENPFQDPIIAQEWIGSVEGEEHMFRDKIIYPLLERWSEDLRPEIILDIGAGQGSCAEHVKCGRYIGVEPSIPLVKRANELFGNVEGREFIVGNVYNLPLANDTVDAAFSVNVWFHLKNLERGTEEMARVLKKNGKFLIITANPNSYKVWESFYENPEQDGNKIVGRVHTPVVPLSKNVFYRHQIENIRVSLERTGLIISEIKEIKDSENEEQALFVSIEGLKR